MTGVLVEISPTNPHSSLRYLPSGNRRPEGVSRAGGSCDKRKSGGPFYSLGPRLAHSLNNWNVRLLFIKWPKIVKVFIVVFVVNRTKMPQSWIFITLSVLFKNIISTNYLFAWDAPPAAILTKNAKIVINKRATIYSNKQVGIFLFLTSVY